ncbi:hypothetical protein CRYUN_Cryun09bG0000200 [Craigia yunnanensis]
MDLRVANSKWITIDGKDISGNGSKTQGNLDFCVNDCQTFDFRTTMRNEPFLQLFHYLYVYPLTVSLSRKRNLFIRVELRKDDADAHRQPLEERLDYLEDGKSIFKLCLRLCSSVYLINERIRDFFLEYDRHTLRTSPPWGSELLEAKGYRVGPVYGDVLAMAWFFLELIVKSMALEQTHLFLSVFH